jgi:beta-galactosidase
MIMVRNYFGKQSTLFAIVMSAFAASLLAQSPRQVLPFDHDWRFLQSSSSNGFQPRLREAGWSRVDLPHDWAIYGPFAAANPSGGAGAFAPEGTGWYRKHFALPERDARRRIFIEFDGIMANSDVWINGYPLGHRPSGYVSLRYELTDHLRFGNVASNVIAVRADNSMQPASRFYEGAGIYRHVRLVIEDPIHTVGDSTFVSTPNVTSTAATVLVQSTIRNDSRSPARISIRATIIDPEGHAVANVTSPLRIVAAGQQQDFEVFTKVLHPELWDVIHPALYRLKLDVVSGSKLTDSDPVTFGIREFRFDPATGFWLNGRNMKLKGVALHSDGGSLGMAVPLGAWEHRLLAMRQMGVNAIRTAHNPVSPDFLDLCDRLGFLVMDEMFDQWTVGKTPYDYHLHFMQWYLADTRDTVRRDRNHPSIILYSAGNEIHDTPRPEIAKPILAALVKTFHDNDPMRPVTMALFRPNASHDYEDGLADMLDVIGQNYRTDELLAAHAQDPNRKIVGTEDIHDRKTWLAMRDHPAFSGEFLWSGTDYLGESRHWPIIGDASGLYDRTDAVKLDGLERQSWWSDAPVVHIVRRVAPTQLAPTDPGYEAQQYRPRQVVFADWTPKNLQPHDELVQVYTNCKQVELLLNGRSLGSKPRNLDASPIEWSVPFQAGSLRAAGSNDGAACGSETLRTAGKPAKLAIAVERARLSSSWDDVAYLRATVTDEDGTVVPDANTALHFSVAGPGRILTTDNADNSDTSGFQHPGRDAYHGTAIAIVRATAPRGNVTVTVSSPGLGSASARLPIRTDTVGHP